MGIDMLSRWLAVCNMLHDTLCTESCSSDKPVTRAATKAVTAFYNQVCAVRCGLQALHLHFDCLDIYLCVLSLCPLVVIFFQISFSSPVWCSCASHGSGLSAEIAQRLVQVLLHVIVP